MYNTARVGGHPIHPMLIPYPFAFLSGAAAFDLAAVSRGQEGLARTASHLRNAGLLTALVAAMPGLVDYLTSVPEGRAKRTATTHMFSNLGALGLFAAAELSHRTGERPRAGTVALELAGTALLGLGGWLGGSLVYHHHVATGPEHAPEPGRHAPDALAGHDAERPEASEHRATESADVLM
jgi:uncharacterized membrane protein